MKTRQNRSLSCDCDVTQFVMLMRLGNTRRDMKQFCHHCVRPIREESDTEDSEIVRVRNYAIAAGLIEGDGHVCCAFDLGYQMGKAAP